MKHVQLTMVCLTLFCFEMVHGQDTLSTYVTLKPMEYLERMQNSNDYLLIDVRTVVDYNKITLPNAQYAPKRAVLFPLVDSLDDETPIFVYCSEGIRSVMVCNILSKRGCKHIYNLKGGIRAWKKKNLPVEKIKANKQ